MTEYFCIFRKLHEYYDASIRWELVEELYEDAKDAATAENAIEKILQLPLVQRALHDKQVFSTLVDLSTQIRSVRTECNGSYDNADDSWDQVIKVSSRDNYLAFIYALSGLINLPNADWQHVRVSLATTNAYFLSLTIPGAKGFHIFEEDIILFCLQIFNLVERMQNPQFLQQVPKPIVIEIWVRFVTFCDDLKLWLRYVHLADHLKVRDELLKKLFDIQYFNFKNGYVNVYMANLHTKCFEIFEEMINAHNGEPEDTLKKLMNMSLYMHTYQSKPKNNSGAIIEGNCEHISDWFIKCIGKYPGLLSKLLKSYIEFTVTNPIKTWKSEHLQRAMEYASKYDAALFTKCNESCVDLLCDAIYAEEPTIRARSIELMLRMLQVESHVDWQMFRHEVSDIPREVQLIKELIKSLRDISNNIRLKAAQALTSIMQNGSPSSKKIMLEGIKFAQYKDNNVLLPQEPRVRKNEIRFNKPTAVEPNYTFKGHEIIESELLQLPDYIYKYLLQCELAFIRRAGLQLIEQIVRHNPIVIFNTHFVEQMLSMVDESSQLVRKASLQCVDGLLSCYPNCFPLIWIWCKLIAPMLRDSDPKNIEMAMECFNSRVLKNLKSIDQSNMAEHFMPWVIVRTMLSTQSRLYLQTCFHQALQRQMVTFQLLSIVESHLLTSNSTEAWILLNFISGKIKSKEPDALIHMFIAQTSWNQEQNTYIALEVLANCIQDFSPAALNLAFTHILTSIENGSMLPVIIGKAFDFLVHISNRSGRQSAVRGAAATANDEWMLKLHEKLEFSILNEVSDFENGRGTLMSHLYSYSEVNMQMHIRPHASIVNFVFKYMSECVKQSVSEWNLENERLFNCVLLLAGRFSLRDPSIASKTIQFYGLIIQYIDRPQIVNTIVVALTDLCKKHTQLVESILEQVMRKLSSSYAVNRLETFKCFERLVLQDQLKLRGPLLIGLLVCLLDETTVLSMRAVDFFDEFCAKKNPTLFQKCLNECPFVLNEYENFEGIEAYSNEKKLVSPLFGAEHQRKRHQLYNHLITKISDIHLVLYFGQLKLLADKAQKDPLLKTPKGIAVVKDVLFILKRVCQVIKEQKSASAAKEGDPENSENALPSLEAETAAEAALPAAAGGRSRRRREVTMPEALEVLEKSIAFISKIYYALRDIDKSITIAFNGFCEALAKRFPDMVDFALPEAFWKKYRKARAALSHNNNNKTNARRKRKREESCSESSSDETEGANNEETATTKEKSSIEKQQTENQAAATPSISPTTSSRMQEEESVPPVPHVNEEIYGGRCSRRLLTLDMQIEYLFRPNI